MHYVPFAAFGGVHCRQDHVVLVEQWRTGEVTCRGRRIEGQFTEESTARGVRACRVLELLDVLEACLRTAVALLDDGFAEASDAADFRGRREWRTGRKTIG